MAIGIIIGAAFGMVVNSLVKDVIMLPIGLLLGKLTSLNYGTFINTVIGLLIVAIVIFLIIRRVNAMRSKPTPPAPNTKDCPHCKENNPLATVRCPHCTSDLGGK
jgi:large conductance mechanosensitive channel